MSNPPPSLSKGAGECSAAHEKENATGWNVEKRFEKPPEGSDDEKKRLFALSEGSDDMKKRLFALSEGSDDVKKRLFALSEGSDDMKKRLFTLSEGSDDVKKRLFALSEGSDDMKKTLFHGFKNPRLFALTGFASLTSSKLLTLGIAQASLALLSLNRNFPDAFE